MLSSLINFTFCQKNEFTPGSEPAASQCTVCAMVGIHSLVLSWSEQFHQILNSPAGHRRAVWEDQTGEQSKRTPERWPQPLLHQPLRHAGPEKHQPVPGEGADAGGGRIHWRRQGGLKKQTEDRVCRMLCLEQSILIAQVSWVATRFCSCGYSRVPCSWWSWESWCHPRVKSDIADASPSHRKLPGSCQGPSETTSCLAWPMTSTATRLSSKPVSWRRYPHFMISHSSSVSFSLFSCSFLVFHKFSDKQY